MEELENKIKTLIVAQICSTIAILLITLYFTYYIDKAYTEMEGIKLFKNQELTTIKSDIQNIYTQMILIHQEIGDHEVRIHKLEPESPTIQLFLKNIKALTEIINMHRRELLKWQKTQE